MKHLLPHHDSKEPIMFFELPSVGQFIDEEGFLYPAFDFGAPDLDNPSHISDMESDGGSIEEFKNSLSERDLWIVDSVLLNADIKL
jgi:hypothetical protein